MGRPKLDRGIGETSEPELDTVVHGPFELKPCPKCESKAEQPYMDTHGFYRCSCSVCKFWDVIVSSTPEEAAKKWQEMGGPAREW